MSCLENLGPLDSLQLRYVVYNLSTKAYIIILTTFYRRVLMKRNIKYVLDIMCQDFFVVAKDDQQH